MHFVVKRIDDGCDPADNPVLAQGQKEAALRMEPKGVFFLVHHPPDFRLQGRNPVWIVLVDSEWQTDESPQVPAACNGDNFST